MKKAELLDRRLLHQGRDLKITLDRVRLPNGHETELELVHHPGASAVVPILDDGRVILLRQYRWAISSWLYEIPAGKLRGGEPPEACAARELLEETGYRAGRLERLGSIWTTPGFSDEEIHLFVARELVEDEQRLEADEVLELEPTSPGRIAEMIRAGELRDTKSLCALQLLSVRDRGAP